MTGQSQGTILYVDDDEVNRYAFTCLFRQAGFVVREAASGGEALRLVAERPDLVILDVNLPDLNGVEVCRQIKAHPATTAIPVLHLSGVYISPQDKTQALQDGSDGYLTKPVEPDELLAQAKALMRIHQAEELARTAARQWQATFDALGDGVCLLDPQGRALRCNRTLAELLRMPAHELLGRPDYELPPGALGPAEETVFQRMRKSGRRESAELHLAGRWLQAVADPVWGEDGTLTGAVYILTDITERKRLDEHLQDSQTQQAATRLAYEAAHDLDSLLKVITGNISLVLAGEAEQDTSRALGLAMELAAWRAAELTRQLLRLGRWTGPLQPGTDLPTRAGNALARARIPRDTAAGAQSRPAAPTGLLPDPTGSAGAHERGTVAPAEHCRSRLTKAEAEELLDWLEANGYPYRALDYEEGNGFLVRWQARTASDRRMQERSSLLQTLRRIVAKLLPVHRTFRR
jgi:PAS domain S-box-containing protein